MAVKNRNISVAEFYKMLQLEFIVAELRHKIYRKKKDREYYSRLMQNKKEKIEDIGKKNFLPNIFNDSIVKEQYYNEIIPEFGFPKFLYIDSLHLAEFEPLDRKYYYSSGNPFRYKKDEKTQTGILRSVNSNEAIIDTESGESVKTNISNIARIL